MQPHHRSKNAFIRLQCASSCQFVLWFICQTFHTMLFLYFYHKAKDIKTSCELYFFAFADLLLLLIFFRILAIKWTVTIMRHFPSLISLQLSVSLFMCKTLIPFWRPILEHLNMMEIIKIILPFLSRVLKSNLVFKKNTQSSHLSPTCIKWKWA